MNQKSRKGRIVFLEMQTLKRLTWDSGKKEDKKEEEKERASQIFAEKTKFETHVWKGGDCKTECRWVSILHYTLEYSWKIHWTDIEQKKDHVLVKHTYKRKVEKIWLNYHCKNGKWKFKSTATGKYTQWKTVTIKGK